MELTAKILGVEAVCDGIIIVIQQNKMQIPVAPEPETDESIMVRKMARSLQGIGIHMDALPRMQCNSGFKTGIWVTQEDYEEMGKPTVGDTLKFTIKAER